jgi:hypothetical protein
MSQASAGGGGRAEMERQGKQSQARVALDVRAHQVRLAEAASVLCRELNQELLYRTSKADAQAVGRTANPGQIHCVVDVVTSYTIH